METLNSSEIAAFSRLKEIIQNESTPKEVERLVAALLDEFLGVTLAVAKSGFQYGGDLGSSGRQGRRLRFEVKKYSDTTALKERELLGEMAQALSRDHAIEAWVLATSVEVPEQVEQSLFLHGETLGVPVLILDWKLTSVPLLGALYSSAPDIVRSSLSVEAGDLALLLQGGCSGTLARMRRDLEIWQIGKESLRAASHANIKQVWSDPAASLAKLGQNAAGGAKENKVRRAGIHAQFDAWWDDPVKARRPLAAIGLNGVGKTWAVVGCLIERLDDLPIVLVVSASAAASILSVSAQGMKEFIAGCLADVGGGSRDLSYWITRLGRLLLAPAEEEPALVIFFDGMNEQASLRWPDILAQLQSDPFAGKVRVILCTRIHHFREKLSSLPKLLLRPVTVEIEDYNLDPDGELDQMLAYEGLRRSDLHPDLIQYARNPRLFGLVVRFREGLIGAGKLTPYRLLWEYGRHEVSDRAGRQFSEREWSEFLAEIARDYRSAGVRTYTTRKIGALTSRHDHEPGEAYARLSEIMDDRFFITEKDGEYEVTPPFVSYSLALILLKDLSRYGQSREQLLVELDLWLDPISGMDEKAEILRAAVSILVERGESNARITSVLLTSWLQTQNLPEGHTEDFVRLASELVNPLLDTIEDSDLRSRASARKHAVAALRSTSRSDRSIAEIVVQRSREWFLRISRDVHVGPDLNGDIERYRKERITKRVGTDESGQRQVLGVAVTFFANISGDPALVAAALLEGYPMALAVPVFEAASIRYSSIGRCDEWEDLKWLWLLNEIDPSEATEELRAASRMFEVKVPEQGLSDRMHLWVAAGLLSFSGEEEDEESVKHLRRRSEDLRIYEEDYLGDPAGSPFRLEQRHAEQVLKDTRMSVWAKVSRTNEMWLDPEFDPPVEFVKELEERLWTIPSDNLRSNQMRTSADIDFEEILVPLARSSPQDLVSFIHKMLKGLVNRLPEAAHWTAIRASNYYLLGNREIADSAKALRLTGVDRSSREQEVAASILMFLELAGRSGFDQCVEILEAKMAFLDLDFSEMLNCLYVDEFDELLDVFHKDADALGNLVILLIYAGIREISKDAWGRMRSMDSDPSFPMRDWIFEALEKSDPIRLGVELLAEEWRWSPSTKSVRNIAGSRALIAASLGLAFEAVAERIVPSLLLDAVRARGGFLKEYDVAYGLLKEAIDQGPLNSPTFHANLKLKSGGNKLHPHSLSIEVVEEKLRLNEHVPTILSDAEEAAEFELEERLRNEVYGEIREVEKAGASLFLQWPDSSATTPFLEACPDAIAFFTDGMEEVSAKYLRRVRLAEGFYLSLCESLLKIRPDLGEKLWRNLRGSIATRFIGVAGIDEFIHIAFRAPSSPSADSLLDHLLDLQNANTDQMLLDLAIAAACNGREEWLHRVIANDLESGIVWKRRRGLVLQGFTCGNSLPIPGAFGPEVLKSALAERKRISEMYRFKEAAAKRWWISFLEAKDAESAYAAWVIFLEAADRRAWCWMRSEMATRLDNTPLSRMKREHVGVNRSLIRNSLENRDDKLGDRFLGLNITPRIGPWAERQSQRG